MPLASRESILRRLNQGAASAVELEQRLGQSQSTVSRHLRQLISEGQIIRIGSTRGARYAELRDIPGVGRSWPLRRIDASGHIRELGALYALSAGEFYFLPASGDFAWGGITPGVPYYLQDQRPSGFLGRAVPLRYSDLNLPQRVIDWSDDHYLRYLTQRGSDTLGDLILGDESLNEYLALQRRREPLEIDQRAARYPQLAEEVMKGGLPGSSAHGEHPKFAVLLAEAREYRHVLVKFSPPISTDVGQRWSDLLVAEHLAHETLRESGVTTAQSSVHELHGRLFLEIDRFDRAGLEGRLGVTSLFSIDAAHYGQLDHWIAAATRLHADKRIDQSALETIRFVATFGALIANTDQHFGNLGFFDKYDGRFELAPIYDMLPMLFAPEHAHLIDRIFTPPDPTSASLSVYGRARALAEIYWRRLASEPRISDGFRQVCATCLHTLEALPKTGAYIEARTD